MFSRTALALIVGACTLTGCTVGPDYHRPAAPLAERYQAQPASQQRKTPEPDSSRLWWESFGDPLLSQFVSDALTQNLAQASARMAQARAGLGAATAALLPSGNISGQAARAYQSVETPLGQVLSSTPDYNRYGNSYETDLNAGWEIDLFGGLRRGRQAALADYQASEAGVAATRLAVAAQTADIYITLRGLQTRLDIANKQVITQQQLLERVQLLHSKGLAPEYQVRQTEGALAQVKATVPVLNNGLDAAMNALDVMLGTPPGRIARSWLHRGLFLIHPKSPQWAPRLTCFAADPILLWPSAIWLHRTPVSAWLSASIIQSFPLTPCLAVQQQYQAIIFSLPVPASRQVCWGYAGGSLTLGVLTRK
jgi:outer membrane protein TolC